MTERPGFVLVTGGAQRVGAVICRRLAADNWPVLIHCNSARAPADALAQEIIAAGGRAGVFALDFLDPGFLDKLAGARLGAVPWVGLVNNASWFAFDTADDFAHATLARMMQINLSAPIALIRALAHAVPVGAPGFAVNITDQKVDNPNPDFFSYTLSKMALAAATDLLAQTFAPRVRVNTVAPGLMLPSGDQTAENFARVHAQTALGAGADPADVAEAVAYLAGAAHVTAATIAVDGGQRLIPSGRDVMFT